MHLIFKELCWAVALSLGAPFASLKHTTQIPKFKLYTTQIKLFPTISEYMLEVLINMEAIGKEVPLHKYF